MDRRERDYQRKYGISVEQYEAILRDQGGVCAICERPPKTRRLHVDHDHKTGEIRGLLCYRCNRALPDYVGLEWLLKAATYIHRAMLSPATERKGHAEKGREVRTSTR